MAGPHTTMKARQERLPLVRQLHEQGVHARDIARILGRSERTVLRDLEDLNLTNSNHYPWTEEQLQWVEQMLDEGCPYAEIGRTLGMHYRTVARRFPGRGCNGSPIGNGRHMRIAEALGLTLDYLRPHTRKHPVNAE